MFIMPLRHLFDPNRHYLREILSVMEKWSSKASKLNSNENQEFNRFNNTQFYDFVYIFSFSTIFSFLIYQPGALFRTFHVLLHTWIWISIISDRWLSMKNVEWNGMEISLKSIIKEIIYSSSKMHGWETTSFVLIATILVILPVGSECWGNSNVTSCRRPRRPNEGCLRPVS